MKLLLVDNAHLYKTPDGIYYTPSIYGYDFFKRYMNVFESVCFAAKTKSVNALDTNNFLKVSGPNLEICEIPWYEGFMGLVKKALKIRKLFKNIDDHCDFRIYRVAQIESFLAFIFSKNKAFALEIVNDPKSFNDVNFIIRNASLYLLKFMLKKSVGVSYVTKNHLQKSYPVKDNTKILGSYSSINLDSTLIQLPKIFNDVQSLKLVHVSNNINGSSKGHETAIEIVAKLNQSGIPSQVSFIGDGTYVEHLKSFSQDMKIHEKVIFVGKLKSQKEVVSELMKHDIFIFPSMYEGLPRVIIEAQSAGLPCVASNVGGIGELLAEEDVFKHNDVDGFVKRLSYLFYHPEQMNIISERNVEIAKSFTKERVQEKRDDFFSKVIAKI